MPLNKENQNEYIDLNLYYLPYPINPTLFCVVSLKFELKIEQRASRIHLPLQSLPAEGQRQRRVSEYIQHTFRCFKKATTKSTTEVRLV